MEGTTRFALFTTKVVCTLLIALGIALARPAWAAEIRVLNANALTIALRELAAEHTKQTGNQVTFVSGSDFGGEPWTARLAFSFAPPAEIDEGVSRLGGLIPAAATVHLP